MSTLERHDEPATALDHLIPTPRLVEIDRLDVQAPPWADGLGPRAPCQRPRSPRVHRLGLARAARGASARGGAPRRRATVGGPAGRRPGRTQWRGLAGRRAGAGRDRRSEEHTSELQSLAYLVCRLLLEK